MLWLSSGPTGTLASGKLGTSRRAASSSDWTGCSSSSRVLMLAPTPRMARMISCFSSLFLMPGISLDTRLRSARRDSTSASISRRLVSSARICSTGAVALRATMACFTSSGFSRM